MPAGSTGIGPNRDGLAALLGLPGSGGPVMPSPTDPTAKNTPTRPVADPLVQRRDEVPPVTEPGRDQPADGDSGIGQPPPAVATPPPGTERVAEAIPVITPENTETPAAVAVPPAHVPAEVPRAVIGWSSLSTRWTAVGRLSAGNELVALDLDHPKAVGIFGYMGSGKSYLLGTVIEAALAPIPGVNSLPAPLAVVIFNYRRNASDRFELNSFAFPNQDASDVERLATEYHARPAAIPDVHVLCLPGELRPVRLREYNPLRATELFFDPQSLDVEDWELLMGEPGSDAVFARTIRNTLVDLRAAGDITLDQLDHEVADRLSGQSRSAARLRFDFVRRYISSDRGVNFAELLRTGPRWWLISASHCLTRTMPCVLPRLRRTRSAASRASSTNSSFLMRPTNT